MLDVPYELVGHVCWLIYTRRRELRSPWRRLSCFKHALLTLAHLRKNETFAQAGAGLGVSKATAWRYVDETIEVLAAWAPGLHESLVALGEGDFVIVDGTLIPTDRIKADEPYYSQKHNKHGMNVQVLAAPDGTPLWFSCATPGHTHDLTSARAHGITQACLTREVLVLADRAYHGADGTVRPLLPPRRTASALPAVQPRARPPRGSYGGSHGWDTPDAAPAHGPQPAAHRAERQPRSAGDSRAPGSSPPRSWGRQPSLQACALAPKSARPRRPRPRRTRGRAPKTPYPQAR